MSLTPAILDLEPAPPSQPTTSSADSGRSPEQQLVPLHPRGEMPSDCQMCPRSGFCQRDVMAKQFRSQMLSICGDFRLKAMELRGGGHINPPLSSVAVSLLKDAERICRTLAAVSSQHNDGIITAPSIPRDNDKFFNTPEIHSRGAHQQFNANIAPPVGPPVEVRRQATTTNVSWSKEELRIFLRLVPSDYRRGFEHRNVKEISLALKNKTRAQVHACYDILGTDARIFSTDCAQLDRHIDRCWTVLRSSHGPQLGVPLLRPLEEMDGQVPHGNNFSELCHNDAEGANMSAGSAGFPLSIHGRRPSVRPSGQGCEDEDSLDLQYPPSDSIRYSVRALPAPNPCRNVPGLWFVKVGASASKILEAKFVVDPEFAAAWDLLPTSSSTSAAHEKSTKAKLCVVLLCLPTAAASALYSSLITTDPTPEGMATAVAGLETAWPQDGTLLIDINKEGIQGKTWLPYDIDPTLPLDVTHCIQAGSNVIRFIQLTSMEERTFILYASRREPDTDMFDDTTPTPSDNPMFNFDASVTVTRFL